MTTTKLTDAAHHIWCEAGSQLSTVREKTRLLREGDQTMDRAVRDAYEPPTVADLHAQATAASELIRAAQQYRGRLVDLLKEVA